MKSVPDVAVTCAIMGDANVKTVPKAGDEAGSDSNRDTNDGLGEGDDIVYDKMLVSRLRNSSSVHYDNLKDQTAKITLAECSVQRAEQVHLCIGSCFRPHLVTIKGLKLL